MQGRREGEVMMEVGKRRGKVKRAENSEVQTAIARVKLKIGRAHV